MTKLTLMLHIASVLAGYGILGSFYLLHCGILGFESVIGCGAVGFVTGIGLMISRKGPSESIWLAISTIAAFLLLILSSVCVAASIRA